MKAARSAYKKRLWIAGAEERALKRAAKHASLPTRRARAKKAWKQKNIGAVNASTARRWAAKLQATPAWANASIIESLYELSSIYAQALNESFHVDHVVPLRSKIVCGLHTHTNLQVLPGVDNIRKSNRVWPGSDGAPI